MTATTPTRYLHCALTGRVYASRPEANITPWNQWAWISTRTADEFDCHEDDVSCTDDDKIAVHGEVVAYAVEG